MPDIYLPIIFVILLLHYAYFLIGILTGLKRLKYNNVSKTNNDFISIIIPFRNESHNILKSLKSIEGLNYPKDKYEVIYINDSSDDDSFEKVSSENKSGNIRVISVPDDFSENAHKKRAVRFGIENSRGDIIFTTDADCIHQPEWIRNMLNCFDENTGFISGPVEFYDGKNAWEGVQKLEFAGLVLAGAGLIGKNRPIICNAANIAYRKKAFEAVNGFNDNMSLSSGDDEFLMQKIWKETSYKVKFCMNREAVVKTDANKTFGQFYNQRKRWASKGLFYTDKLLVFKLVLIFFFYAGLFIMPFLAAFVSKIYLLIFAVSIIIKFLLEYKILNTGSRLLFSNNILKNFYMAELLQVPYIIIAGISGLFGNFTWKERKVKR
jgi:cellulose synthase/poly-beta-1,6-N-acetylglucosamine synthase-like glycosyltransferase